MRICGCNRRTSLTHTFLRKSFHDNIKVMKLECQTTQQAGSGKSTLEGQIINSIKLRKFRPVLPLKMINSLTFN